MHQLQKSQGSIAGQPSLLQMMLLSQASQKKLVSQFEETDLWIKYLNTLSDQLALHIADPNIVNGSQIK